MKLAMIALSLGIAALLAGCSDSATKIKGDAVRGEAVHQVCLDCHGTELYASPERKIKSLKELRREVARWGDYYSPALTPQDNEDVVVYLNTQFYKF
jgi:cytochrome c2